MNGTNNLLVKNLSLLGKGLTEEEKECVRNLHGNLMMSKDKVNNKQVMGWSRMQSDLWNK